jgi:hypothetical protein
MRLAQRAHNTEAYKSLRRRIPRETLRKRGVEYVTEPPVSLRPTWLQYVTDPQWLKVEPWLELANALAQVAQLDAGADSLPSVNFGIRGYRMVAGDWLRALLQRIGEILDVVISQPRPAGIEHIEPDPFRLFLCALDQAEPARIRRCPVCARYFYSHRQDQIACSKRCANAERQRRFRQNRRRYEENRKRNRAAREQRELRYKQELLGRLKPSRTIGKKQC